MLSDDGLFTDLLRDGVSVGVAAAHRDDVRVKLDRLPALPEGVKNAPGLQRSSS